MKIKMLRLANAIRVGTEVPAESFFSTDKGYDIELMPGGQIIKIITKSRKSKTFTTIFNVLNFDKLDDDGAESVTKKGRSAAEAAVN